MSAMSVALGFGFVPSARAASPMQPRMAARAGVLEAPAVTQEVVMVKRKLEALTLNELLYQALYGDVSQFCSDSKSVR